MPYEIVKPPSNGCSDLTYLKDVFKARLAGQATTVVVSDCRVDWNQPAGGQAAGPGHRRFRGRRAPSGLGDPRRGGRRCSPAFGGRGYLAGHATERRGEEGRLLLSGGNFPLC